MTSNPKNHDRRRQEQSSSSSSSSSSLNVHNLASWMLQDTSLRDALRSNVEISKFLYHDGHDDGIQKVNKLMPNISIKKFGFGQSNPTYLITISNTATANNGNHDDNIPFKMVLRKKPNKIAHASAHALHREYRVLMAMLAHNQQYEHEKDVHVPVPVPYSYCTDKSVLGAEFYLMEYVDGRIFTDPSMVGMTPEDRSLAYKDVIRTLANIHTVDVDKVGLSNYGKKGKYVQRQIGRLLNVSQKQSQLLAGKNYSTHENNINNNDNNNEEIEALAKQLISYASECPNYLSLVHGDYKIDNIIFHKTEPKVIAVIDWEMSTIGDSFCDVANLSMMYYMPRNDHTGISGIHGLDLYALGIPERIDLLKMYCHVRMKGGKNEGGGRGGQQHPSSNSNLLTDALQWDTFYLAFLFFKNCVIVQGVAQRSKSGVASSTIAETVGRLFPTLVFMTQKFIDEHVQASISTGSRL